MGLLYELCRQYSQVSESALWKIKIYEMPDYSAVDIMSQTIDFSRKSYVGRIEQTERHLEPGHLCF